MSDWRDLEPDSHALRVQQAPVRFGLLKPGGGKGRARGTVLMRADICKALGEPLHVGLRLLIGNSRLAVVNDPLGRFPLSKWRSAPKNGVTVTYRVVLPIVERFPDKSITPIQVNTKFEKLDGKTALVIDLPGFCWSNDAAISRPDAAGAFRGRPTR